MQTRVVEGREAGRAVESRSAWGCETCSREEGGLAGGEVLRARRRRGLWKCRESWQEREVTIGKAVRVGGRGRGTVKRFGQVVAGG